VILACTVLIQLTSVMDGRTEGRTDGRPDDGKDTRSILLSRVKTNIYIEIFTQLQRTIQAYGYLTTYQHTKTIYCQKNLYKCPIIHLREKAVKIKYIIARVNVNNTSKISQSIANILRPSAYSCATLMQTLSNNLLNSKLAHQ